MKISLIRLQFNRDQTAVPIFKKHLLKQQPLSHAPLDWSAIYIDQEPTLVDSTKSRIFNKSILYSSHQIENLD